MTQIWSCRTRNMASSSAAAGGAAASSSAAGVVPAANEAPLPQQSPGTLLPRGFRANPDRAQYVKQARRYFTECSDPLQRRHPGISGTATHPKTGDMEKDCRCHYDAPPNLPTISSPRLAGTGKTGCQFSWARGTDTRTFIKQMIPTQPGETQTTTATTGKCDAFEVHAEVSMGAELSRLSKQDELPFFARPVDYWSDIVSTSDTFGRAYLEYDVYHG